MAYHIKTINNQSARSVVLYNPVTPKDDKLIGPTTQFQYPSGTEPLINPIQGNVPPYPAYNSLLGSPAMNIYTSADNYFFWDDGSSVLAWVGENKTNNSEKIGAGFLTLSINEQGAINFDYAEAKATATA